LIAAIVGRGEQGRIDRREPLVAPARADVVDVGARDERRLAAAGDDQDARVAVHRERAERPPALLHRREIERVLDLGPIDRQRRD